MSELRGPLWRAATGVGGALIGAVAGFSFGMLFAAVATPLLSRVVSTDGEGWEILWVWAIGAFGGAGIGALVGLVMGVGRQRTKDRATDVPTRPDASMPEPTAR